MGTSKAHHVSQGDMDPQEFRKLQSMLGGAKAKDTHTVSGMKGVTGYARKLRMVFGDKNADSDLERKRKEVVADVAFLSYSQSP